MGEINSSSASAENLGKNHRRWIFLLFSFFAPILLFAPILFLVRQHHDSIFMHGPFKYVKSIQLRNAGMIDGAFGCLRRTYKKLSLYRSLNSVDGWNGLRCNVETKRLRCRELSNGAESCVFTGIAFVDVSKEPKLKSKDGSRHLIYLVDDNCRDGETVSSDSYCQKSNMSADPRYYGPKEWPPRDYFAPRHSCLNAQWRTRVSLFGNRTNPPSVRWLNETSLVDLDFLNHFHINHYLTSTAWMLDIALWKNLMSQIDNYPRLFAHTKHILFN